MDNLEFNKQLINYANTLNIGISEEQANELYEYFCEECAKKFVGGTANGNDSQASS